MTAEDEQDEAFREGMAALERGDLEAASAAGRRHVPLHGLMGLNLTELEDQVAVATMELTNEVRGPATGSVHGGILATFADVTSGFSLNGAYDLNAEMAVTTDIHIRYYRQPRSGPLTAVAKLVHKGRRLLSTECSVTDADQRESIRSTATYMLVPRRL